MLGGSSGEAWWRPWRRSVFLLPPPETLLQGRFHHSPARFSSAVRANFPLLQCVPISPICHARQWCIAAGLGSSFGNMRGERGGQMRDGVKWFA